MVGESFAIIVVILVLVVMYLRAGRRLSARLALPLVSMPAAYLLSVAFLGHPQIARGAQNFYLRCGVMAVGLVLTVALCVLLARNLEFKKSRIGYILISCIFSLALTVAYLMYLL